MKLYYKPYNYVRNRAWNRTYKIILSRHAIKYTSDGVIKSHISLEDQVKEGDAKFEIVGSFRRGADKSGNIDIIVNDEVSFNNFIKSFIDKNILIYMLTHMLTDMLTYGKVKN